MSDTLPNPVFPNEITPDQPVPQPAELAPVLPAASYKRSKVRKFTIGLMLVTIPINGHTIYKSLNNESDSRPPVDDNAVEFTVDGNYDLPEVLEIPASTYPSEFGRVDNDLREALSVDTCETKVSPESAFSMYLRLFGSESAPSENYVRLQDQAEAATQRLRDTAEQLTFNPLPKEKYATLLKDARSDKPQIPLEEYQKALTDFVAPLGVTTLYNWQAGKEDAAGIDVAPVDPVANGSDIMARNMIVDTMGSFATIPKELLERSDTNRIVFGDIPFDNAVGMSVSTHKDISFDIADYKNSSLTPSRELFDIFKITTPHELSHQLHFATCFKIMGKYVGDNAFRSLGGGVIYDEDLQQKSQAKTIVTLQNDDPGVATNSRPAGASSDKEDVATIGEIAFSGPDAQLLYKNDANTGQDLAPIREKFALLLARLNEKDPRIADYYVSLLQAARLRVYASKAINEIPAGSDARPYFEVRDTLDGVLNLPS